MKDNSNFVFVLLIVILFMLLDMAITRAIFNTNWPDWVKLWLMSR